MLVVVVTEVAEKGDGHQASQPLASRLTEDEHSDVRATC